ncbi:MAG: lipid-A-disaccharide synthase [Mangrovibacterium sp.]
MKYFFIAGEASGDLHASNLIKELLLRDSSAQIEGLGGELMESAGMKLLRHYREMAFMGFIPVLMNLGKVKNNFDLCKKSIKEFMPDVLILIDYPSFNLKMAEYAKTLGIKVYYYISPKVWVWKKGRIKKMRILIDELFTIFPFETDFFANYNMNVNYVGNPVMDAVFAKKIKLSLVDFQQQNHLDNRAILAIVPGSRLQEIRSLLPKMLEATQSIDTHQLLVTTAPNIDEDIYTSLIKGYKVTLIREQTYETLQMADLAVVASGTVTLETAILKCPQVVCYRMGGGMPLYYVGKWLLGIQFVSLVNIVLKRMAVPELLQHFCTSSNIHEQLNRIITDIPYRTKMMNAYEELSDILGGGGASAKAAQLIVQKLKA